MITAGIDGGGTGTTVEVWDSEGAVQSRRAFGSLNLNGTGETAFRQTLREILAFLGAQGECGYLCAGLAGVSNPEVRRCFEEEMRHTTAGWTLCGDHEIALYGASSGSGGISLIAGTGSICVGRLQNGSLVRAGGWGHLIDDGGSGYDIGRAALHAAVASLDAREEKTALTGIIFEKWGLNSAQDLIHSVYGSSGKEHIASLAMCVEEAARDGDAVASGILDDAARKLAGLICAVENGLRTQGAENISDALPCYFFGGLLTHETGLKKRMVEWIRTRASLRLYSPGMDAASGAALMAYRALGKK